MGLVISKGLTLRKGWQPMDTDAAAYITAVETADGQALEAKTKIAIDNFVLGCKADGIWNAIKASCILAGASTRAWALTPLVALLRPASTSWTVTTTGRLGWWGMGAQSIWTVIGITMLIRRTITTRRFMLAQRGRFQDLAHCWV
jgi:hypothetical protein